MCSVLDGSSIVNKVNFQVYVQCVRRVLLGQESKLLDICGKTKMQCVRGMQYGQQRELFGKCDILIKISVLDGRGMANKENL